MRGTRRGDTRAMKSDDALAVRLAASLPMTRWFAHKAERIAGVTIRERLSLPQSSADLIVADVALEGHASPTRYVVMIDEASDEAGAMPACSRWLLDLLLAGGAVYGRGGRFVGHRIAEPAGTTGVPPVGPVVANAIGGDASNTTLVVRCAGTAWVVKIFRRCRAGISPEVEIGEFFATSSPWRDTPRLRGWLEYVPEAVPSGGPPDEGSIAIATLHEFMPDHTTGWNRLVHLLTEGRGIEGRFGRHVVDIVAALGRVTARMHRAFAARPDIPAFAPALATAAGLESATTRMRTHADHVFASIESRLPHLPPTLAPRMHAVLAARARLTSRWTCPPGLVAAVSTIRVHGDYHLGQVLVAEHDDEVTFAEHDTQPLVIDFEGEPGRSLDERREKTFAAKDVAGMCRSFDYLLRHVAKSTRRPYAPADLQRLEDSYLDAYRNEAAGEPWWPVDRMVADALLGMFKLDKAIYELAYEVDNRPDWIDVPLAAIEEVTAANSRSP